MSLEMFAALDFVLEAPRNAEIVAYPFPPLVPVLATYGLTVAASSAGPVDVAVEIAGVVAGVAVERAFVVAEGAVAVVDGLYFSGLQATFSSPQSGGVACLELLAFSGVEDPHSAPRKWLRFEAAFATASPDVPPVTFYGNRS